ncbi:SET methyltransferase domain containing protein [Nitzschia inconspicua]|uniref:SET methyltransferase domain containing protein n=1 Tax=Nitzschia inconspicua TaxID=303405 RepID=A0A9K3LDA7_9STRA|nr:SET methyltransferase domain containing protein [Nitzschia inconspicua]
MKRQHHEISNNNSAVSSPPCWWYQISDEIRSQGGHVADCLEFDDTRREIVINHTVKPETLLFEIPATSMISKEKALKLCPWLKDVKESDAVKFNNSTTDLILATAMAAFPGLLYLQTLPESASFDALPRRWHDNVVRDLLGSTSIYGHVQAAKSGTKQDYERLKGIFQNQHQGSSSSFPSFPKFDDMLAAVTSRAFQIGNIERDVALVPLLDLCNHSRGKDMKRNVSYQIVGSDVEDESPQRMVVRSVATLQPGDTLTLTYGALGNSQLLLNYGFCIANNVEPDGSSNDVLELVIEVDGQVVMVPLRAGPKSYSYGCFTKAVDVFRSKMIVQDINDAHDAYDEDDDLERFLNETRGHDNEEHNNDSVGGFNTIYDPEGWKDDGNFNEKGLGSNDIKEELHTLINLRQELVKRLKALETAGCDDPISVSTESNPAAYAAILRHSERRTIYFFARAVEKVCQKLSANDETKNDELRFSTSTEDFQLIEEQTTELSNVYLVLRKGIM